MFDYEWATVQHNVNCRLARAVVVPDAIPPERLERYGAKRQGARVRGPQGGVLPGGLRARPRACSSELGLDPSTADRRGAHAAGGVALPPLRERSVRAACCERLREAAAADGVQPVVLPRVDSQRRELAGVPGFVVPEHAIDAQSLIAYADLVISAGGTMNREAVALGTPVYTTFEGRLGAVDERLIEEGRLRKLGGSGGARFEQARAGTRPQPPIGPPRRASAPRPAGSGGPVAEPAERLSSPYNRAECADGSARRPFPYTDTRCPSSRWTGCWSRSRTTSPSQLRFDNGAAAARAAARLSAAAANGRSGGCWAGSLVVLVLARVYQRRWRYAGQRDYEAILRAVVLIVAAERRRDRGARARCTVTRHGITVGGRCCRSAWWCCSSCCACCSCAACGCVARALYERRPLAAFRGGRKGERSVLIVGAGDGGRLVLREIVRNRGLGLQPVGFLDDDPRKRGLRIDGVKVRGNTEAGAAACARRDRARRGDHRDSLRPGVHTCARRARVPLARHPGADAADRVRAAADQRRGHARAADARGARRGRARARAGADGARAGGCLSGRGDGARDRRGRLDRRGAVPSDRARGAAPDRAGGPRRGQPVPDPARARRTSATCRRRCSPRCWRIARKRSACARSSPSTARRSCSMRPPTSTSG